LTATPGQDCSQVVNSSAEPFSKLPRLQHIAPEQACVKTVQLSMLDKDWCQEPEASGPKHTWIMFA